MARHQQFSASFLLLQQEGHLISTQLAAGLTELRSAHVHNKGAFYSALFNLSVGMERLLKAIVIIDHMLRNNLTTPTISQLKAYGHNVVELYDTCVAISENTNARINDRRTFDETDLEIINLLSNFAQSTRYHNLDALSRSNVGKDPLSHWEEILTAILRSDVPQKKQEKILERGRLVAEKIDDITLTIMHGLDRRQLSTEEALTLPSLHEEAVKHAVLRIVTMLAQVRELISELSHCAYGLSTPTPAFPQMQEFLEWLWDDRKYVLRKKRWP
jgi:hypothetical protein